MSDKDGNNIESIEAMAMVSFKSLKVLNFSMNYIMKRRITLLQ